jgi:integrase/recombinase XerD
MFPDGGAHYRHDWGTSTLMLDAGADVRYVAEMLGHQKLETTMIYTRASMTKLREVHAATQPAEQAARNPALHNQTCHAQTARRYT